MGPKFIILTEVKVRDETYAAADNDNYWPLLTWPGITVNSSIPESIFIPSHIHFNHLVLDVLDLRLYEV